MNALPGTKRLGEQTGKIVRWGDGFGFIRSSGLKKDAYFKEAFVEIGEPVLGAEVEFEAVEYPGDKVVARDVRVVGSAKPERGAVAPAFAGRIRGVEALSSVAIPAPRPPATPVSSARVDGPATLQGVVRAAHAKEQERVSGLRDRAAELAAAAASAADAVSTARADAERKRKELERQLAQLDSETQERVQDLLDSSQKSSAESQRLTADVKSIEAGATELVARTAAAHLSSARARFSKELVRRARAASASLDARAHAVRGVGEERVAKYEEARRRAKAEHDPDEREAFSLLERQRREAVRAYAEALDANDVLGPLEVPFSLVGCADGSVALVAPYDAGSIDTDGVMWRLHSALMHAAERARLELVTGDAPSIDRATVAGCLALRLVGLDFDLMPLLLDDAFAARPSLSKLGLKVQFDEARDVCLPISLAVSSVELADSAPVATRATGGSTREVARRLGLDLDELIATLVGAGLPFGDDVVSMEAEQSLRALLGIPTETEPRQRTSSREMPAARVVPPALDIAGRIVGKLLRSHVIGGKHTRIENVYGHHFADSEKDMARAVTEKLIRGGVLREKKNVGARHVSLEPRRLDVVRALADRRCEDRAIVDALQGA